MPTPDDFELALQRLRDLHELLRRAHRVIDRRDRHEDEADGEQHLVEMAARIDMDVERALEQAAEQRRDQKSDRQAEREGHAEPVDQDDGAIAARHGEGAMREIDEVHQAERDGEPACQHEQQHAVGDTVKQDGQHACS